MTNIEPLDLDALPVGAAFTNPNGRERPVWQVVSDCLDGTEIRYQSTDGDEVFNTRTLTRGDATYVQLVDPSALIAEVRRLQEICTRALAAANRVDVADYEFDSASIVDVERILKETR